MNKKLNLNIKHLICLFSFLGILNAKAEGNLALSFAVDSPEVNLPYPITDTYSPFGNLNLIDFNNPSNINSSVIYDPSTGQYSIFQNYGDFFYRNPATLSNDEYLEYSLNQTLTDNWQQITDDGNSTGENEEDDLLEEWRPELNIKSEVFDRIFGGNTIDIRPQGTAELSFGINRSKTENPRIPERQRSITTFDFNQKIQLNVVGNIGDKLKLNTNYNTEAAFDFENKMKLDYSGDEDEIIQRIEAGDVSLPLQNSLITGSQTLFGLKTELKFGRLRSTVLFSQERGQRKEIDVSGGAQTQDYDITCDNYEANKHYFLSHFFRQQYDQALASMPVVNSGVNITRIEVWVTNTRANFEENRNFVAFTDIGEDIPSNVADGNINTDIPLVDSPGNFPDNEQNSLYNEMANNSGVRSFTGAAQALSALGYEPAVHYEEVENARRLETNEYSFNQQLGFISLNQSLNNDEVLAVAYQYTLNGQTYQVGEFSTDGIEPPNALLLKLLKATITNPNNPLWDLMMKNVYSLGAFQVNSENFQLNIWYNDPLQGVDIPFIPQDGVDQQPLIQTLAMDRIDQNTNPTPDGVFDYVDNAATRGGTINSRNGRIYFPVVEPFGSHLEGVLTDAGTDQAIINQIVYNQLYDSTKTAAIQLPELNRFRIKGSYQSASSDEISLNAINVPQGSVTVTAGGVRLVEGVDYQVDYNLGRVKILNQGLLEAQTPIKISLESNSLFSIQTKTLMGTRFDYQFKDDVNIGATILNLTERPLTQKINFGNEPISNTIWGLDGNYSTESQFITKMVDRLPFLETKEKSTLNFSGEVAQLIPGHSRAITKEGLSYIDDFEGSQSTIDIRNFAQWNLASTPQGQPDLFPEAMFVDSLIYGEKRGKLSWYVIDPIFFNENNGITLTGVTADERSDHRMRRVLQEEVFPDRQLPTGTPGNIPTLDLTFYPDERGPYNYSPDLVQTVDGELKLNNDPTDNWGGLMRSLTTTDFEQANVEFIQFWLMDPFNEDSENNSGGELYFNVGNISEDILRDSRKSFENGLPSENDPEAETDTTAWAIVPTEQAIVNAFDNTTNSNALQDVGLDGMSDAQEAIHLAPYINGLPGNVQNTLLNGTGPVGPDPAGDDFHYFRGSDYDNLALNTLERYKDFNGVDGNSITTQDSNEDFPTQGTTLPSTEDINQDQNLSKSESYFQYRVRLTPNLQVGQNYVTDIAERVAQTPNGPKNVRWYQFKIPLRDLGINGAKRVNGIQDFRSIRFIRMFMKGWSEEVTLRFARLELIRGEWRKYVDDLGEPGENEGDEIGQTTFDISAVNIEENSSRFPINYILPPGITREIDAGTANLRNLNEQSLAMDVCNLKDGDARAAFRNVLVDMRSYKKLKMFVHAESTDENLFPLNNDDVTIFVRLGTDYNQNYYEYEIPLAVSPWGSNTEDAVWPERNNMEIVFKDLQRLKTERNLQQLPLNQEYIGNDGRNLIKVKGNPVLSAVKTIMIGVRNPKRETNPFSTIDDGLEKCFEVWVNELRLSDFDQRGGWAAIARVNAQLADFGTVSVAGNYSTPGFGSIEKKVSERQRETIRGIDATSNLELGKFFPEKSGVKIPMYLGFSETVITPQFDPLSPDIEFSDIEANFNNEEKRKRQNYSKLRSINFTNVRKEKSPDKKILYPWDISNFTFSYSYSETFLRDINTEYNNNRTYRGGLTYSYSPKPLEIKPFAKLPLVRKSNWLKLIKDVNFNLGPKQFSFRTDINRTYNESQARNNIEGFDFPPIPQYTKTFNWTRIYDVKYDLTKSLKLDFNANNRAIIDEPQGRVNKEFVDEYQAFKDTVWASIRNFGETTDYNHTVNLTYNLPLDKFPLTDWVSVNTRYSGTYNWLRAPFSQDSLGNTIQNSRNMSVNGQFNFVNLYNKSGYLKKLNGNGRSRRTASKNTRSTKKEENEKDDDKDKKDGFKPQNELLKIAMALKNVSVTFSQNEGTVLPGFNRRTNVLGMDPNFSAPGWGFIAGFQDENYPFEAARQGWLIENANLNNAYGTTFNQTFNFRANLEPIKNMRIEITANSTKTNNLNGFFRFNESIEDYVLDSPLETGSYSASIITLGSAFRDKLDNNGSAAFEQFLVDRQIISNRLGDENPNSFIDPSDDNFFDGYSGTNQDVVIPAFISAYRGKDPNSVKLDPLSQVPLPNWRITYDGLSRIPLFKELFKSVTINHAYRSAYSVNTYTSNLNFQTDDQGFPIARDVNDNYIPDLQIDGVSISEQFSPLINVDVKLRNSFDVRLELKKSRNLTLSMTNFQITENRSDEIVAGVGYVFEKLKMKLGGKKFENDLRVRADLSIRDNLTITRRMVEDNDQPTSGQKVFSIKTAADYELNKQLNLRFFYDHQITEPKISLSFPTSNINAGIALRFILSQ
ncbi:MAG: cell surface protein SprA [Bacteroidota bacterium]